MAYKKLNDDYYLVTGRCTEPKFQYVGDNRVPKCTAGIPAGKYKDRFDADGKPETIWFNVVAWRDLAYVLYQAHKGDAVLVTGQLKKNEWEGKTYWDFVAEFIHVAQRVDPYANAAPHAAPAAQNSGPGWAELSDDDGELPF